MDRKEMETILGKFVDEFRDKVRNDLKEQVDKIRIDVRQEIQEQRNDLKEQLVVLRSDVRQEIQEQMVPVSNKIDELDARSKKQDNRIETLEMKMEEVFDSEQRKRNIIFYNMPEMENENLQQVILYVINNIIKVKCETYNIDYVSRLGYGTNGKRPIIVKFTTLNMKIEVWKNRSNLKSQEYHMGQDYSQETRNKRKALVPQLKLLHAKGIKAAISRNHEIVTWSTQTNGTGGQTPRRDATGRNSKRQLSITPESSSVGLNQTTTKRFQGISSSPFSSSSSSISTVIHSGVEQGQVPATVADVDLMNISLDAEGQGEKAAGGTGTMEMTEAVPK